MNEAATASSGQPLRDRYVLRERLGAGGQGEVWRAFDPQTGTDVALKLLTPAPGRSAAAWVALVHEHESASRLDHPGILNAAIIGVPDERLGERMCAVAVTKPGVTLELGSLCEFLAGKGLSKHYLPERLIVLDELPMTQSGKIQKFKLRELISSCDS